MLPSEELCCVNMIEPIIESDPQIIALSAAALKLPADNEPARRNGAAEQRSEMTTARAA